MLNEEEKVERTEEEAEESEDTPVEQETELAEEEVVGQEEEVEESVETEEAEEVEEEPEEKQPEKARFIPQRRFNELSERLKQEREDAKREADDLRAQVMNLSQSMNRAPMTEREKMINQLKSLPEEALMQVHKANATDADIVSAVVEVLAERKVQKAIEPIAMKQRQIDAWSQIANEFPDVQRGTQYGKDLHAMALELYKASPALQATPDGVLQAMRQASVVVKKSVNSDSKLRAEKAKVQNLTKKTISPGGKRIGKSTPSLDEAFKVARSRGEYSSVYDMLPSGSRARA